MFLHVLFITDVSSPLGSVPFNCGLNVIVDAVLVA